MFTNNLIAGASGQQGSFYPHAIDQSLRFNDNDSAYLNRTPASAGNRKTWTWSGWVKRGNLSGSYNLFSAGTSNTDRTQFGFTTSDALVFYDFTGSTTNLSLVSSAVYRDTSAWYHIVAVADTDNATQADRARFYVNGERVTNFSTNTNNLTSGFLFQINGTDPHGIGRRIYDAQYYDGYLAEVNFIDGQALDPTDFGEFKSGVWVAKEYTGSYGTNGFYLNFSDSANIGDDLSGNANDWTANNLAATDVVLDSPTQNFCTFNSAIRPYPSADTLSEGNLKRTNTATGVTGSSWGTFSVTSGKWYYETAIQAAGALTCWIGWANDAIKAGGGTYTSAARDNAYMYMSNGNKALDSATGTAYGASYTTGDVIGVELDADNDTITFYKNGVSQGVAFTGISTVGSWIPAISSDPGWVPVANFGQDSSFAGNKTAQGNTDANGVGDFFYAPPSGFLALAAQNLPTPAIDPAKDDVPADYFDVSLWTGNGTGQSITGLTFQPDWVWLKQRSGTQTHQLLDAVRGKIGAAASYARLRTDTTATEATPGSDSGLLSLNSDGFTLGTDAAYNQNSSTYVAWNWLAGNGTSSNSDGSISSTISVNQKAGFSIVSYTGNGTSGATVGHGLGVAPKLLIIKNRDAATNWRVYTTAVDGTMDSFFLNDTSAKVDSGSSLPTSTVFELGTNSDQNASGNDYIVYCFAEVEAYSKFGVHNGSGSTDGTFVYTGFAPAFVMQIKVNAASNRRIWDDVRVAYNPMNKNLIANDLDAEVSGSDYAMDLLSNGFKHRSTNPAIADASGSSYVYFAWASMPFKYANAR